MASMDAMIRGGGMSHGSVIGFLNADDFYAHANVFGDVAELMNREYLDALFDDVGFFHPEKPTLAVKRFYGRCRVLIAGCRFDVDL